jgi:hypothetical protein
MRSGAPALLSAAFTLALAVPAIAQPATTMVSGDRINYGRIVINPTGPTRFHVVREGDRVSVRLDPKIVLGDAPVPPRNVTALATSGSTINLLITPGARLHASRQGGSIVLDIRDPIEPPALRGVPDLIPPPPVPPPAPGDAPPAPALPHQAAVTPPPSSGFTRPLRPPEPAGPQTEQPAIAAPSGAAPTGAAPPAPVPAAAPASQASAAPVPVTATALAAQAAPDDDADADSDPLAPGRDVTPERPDAPLDLRVRPAHVAQAPDEAAIFAPFSPTTGAAAFADADGIDLVFDERRPLDVSALARDPVFSGVTVQLLAAGTLLRLPPQPGRHIALTPLLRGWRIAFVPGPSRVQPVTFAISGGKVSLGADMAGAVLSMADPRTGATLLIGTQRHAGQGVSTPRRAAEFVLHPSLMGVVLEPFSDRISLKRTATGFQLSAGPKGLFLSPQTIMTDALADAAHLSRRFSFPTMPLEALRAQLRDQIDDAASAPPLVRGRLNHRAAQTMLALGMGSEAEGLLQLAAQEDPNEAASAGNAGLGAIAALLAGRVAESDALTDPRLDGTDEIALWRAVREAMRDKGSPDAAAVFSRTAPLAMAYPPALRDDVLPLILETMVQGGEIEPAKRLLAQRPGDPSLDYARALLLQAEGNLDGALAALDRLANGWDRYNRARAAVRAVELRLAAHKLTTLQAADALDALRYAWRGDSRALAVQERIAELRAQNGQWSEALHLLRTAEDDYPDHADEVRQRLRETFTAMVHDNETHRLKPLEFVSLVDENAGLVHETSIEEGVDRKLADDLLALDLPQRAEPVLEKLLANATTDEARARYGLSLAKLRDGEGHPAEALATLDQYHGQALPAELAEERLLVRAGATAHTGNFAAAAALLAPLRSARAAAARAGLEESAGDWPAAEQAWADCVALTLPHSGTLDQVQAQTVLRLATAAAHAKDDAAIAGLRERYGARIPAGPLADMFRLLTAAPVQTPADIARSAAETSLAAALPTSLKALKADTPAL